MADPAPHGELEKTPTGSGAVNKPASGTYGEKADLDRLRQSLPPIGPPGEAGVGAAPMVGPGGQVPQRPTGRPKNSPANIPAGMLAPTQRPGVPLDQPLAATPQMPARQPAQDQQRLAILDALSTHPEVSPETQEWAKLLMEALIGGR